MAERTLVILPDSLDQMVLALPAIHAVTARGRATVLAPNTLRPLATLVPGVEAALAAEEPAVELAARLRRGGFDEAVLLDDGLWPAWLAWQARIPRRWGYGGPLRRWLLEPPVRRPRRARHRHRSERHRELVAALGVAPPASWRPRIEPSPEVREAARERFARVHITEADAPVVGFVPVGRFGRNEGRSVRGRLNAAHHWPWKRFVLLIQALRQEVPGLRGLLLAGAGRESLWPAIRIYEEAVRFHPLMGPDLKTDVLAGVLARLDLVVGADSDLLQLAAAAGTPTVTLFGPTLARLRGPRGEGHRMLPAPGRDLRRLPLEPVLQSCLEALSA